VSDAHRWLALLTVVATFALAASTVWSIAAARRSDGQRDHRFAVDRLVLVVEALLAVNAVLGAGLAAIDAGPADGLHLLYGPAAILTLPIGWAVGVRRRADGLASRLRRDAWLLGAALILIGLEARLFLTG
jgi:hypothetical protein